MNNYLKRHCKIIVCNRRTLKAFDFVGVQLLNPPPFPSTFSNFQPQFCPRSSREPCKKYNHNFCFFSLRFFWPPRYAVAKQLQISCLFCDWNFQIGATTNIPTHVICHWKGIFNTFPTVYYKPQTPGKPNIKFKFKKFKMFNRLTTANHVGQKIATGKQLRCFFAMLSTSDNLEIIFKN